MNPCIRLDDLDRTPYNELIQTLTSLRVRAELPDHGQGLTYGDYQTDIRILLLTTQNPDRPRALVQAVLTQATKHNVGLGRRGAKI